VSARIQIGSDRRRAAIDRLRGIPDRGGQQANRASGPMTAESFKERLNALVMNPVAIALELRDSLALTAEQVEQLESLRDSATARRDSIAKSIETRLTEDSPDPRALAALLRGAMEQAVGNVPAEVAEVRRVLSDEQWQRMPEVVRQR
jgi:hypothetical protein